MQKKKCRIYAGLPITCFEVPIIGNAELNLTADEIYKCLCSKAEVIEILPDGSYINLDFTNYNKDNKKEEIKETTNVINTPVTEKTTSEFNNALSTEETTESTSAVIEEDKDVETEEEVVLEVEDEVQIQEEIKEIEEDVETEEETESTVNEEVVETTPAPVKATTVAEYQVASRNNNNNYKKAKNKK